jgi:hypothetical protein
MVSATPTLDPAVRFECPRMGHLSVARVYEDHSVRKKTQKKSKKLLTPPLLIAIVMSHTEITNNKT